MPTNVERLRGVSDSLGQKAPVRAATTANITLAGLLTIDGVTLASGDRVLVKNQTNGVQNGIYNVSSGNWTRAYDMDGARDVVQGTAIFVAQGTVNTGAEFYVANNTTVTVDTSAIVFARRTLREFTPEAYGALGGGAIDTAAMTTFINGLNAAGGYGVISQPITIDAPLPQISSNVTLECVGNGSIVLAPSASTAFAFGVVGFRPDPTTLSSRTLTSAANRGDHQIGLNEMSGIEVDSIIRFYWTTVIDAVTYTLSWTSIVSSISASSGAGSLVFSGYPWPTFVANSTTFSLVHVWTPSMQKKNIHFINMQIDATQNTVGTTSGMYLFASRDSSVEGGIVKGARGASVVVANSVDFKGTWNGYDCGYYPGGEAMFAAYANNNCNFDFKLRQGNHVGLLSDHNVGCLFTGLVEGGITRAVKFWNTCDTIVDLTVGHWRGQAASFQLYNTGLDVTLRAPRIEAYAPLSFGGTGADFNNTFTRDSRFRFNIGITDSTAFSMGVRETGNVFDDLVVPNGATMSLQEPETTIRPRYKHFFYVSRSDTGASTFTANAWTRVTFTNEINDPFSMWATPTATLRFPGAWMFNTKLRMSLPGSGAVAIYKTTGGTTPGAGAILLANIVVVAAISNEDVVVHIPVTKLAQNDTVEVWVKNDHATLTGSIDANSAESKFWGELIS